VVSFGSVKEKTFSLIEPGEYVLTLSELEQTTGNWGDRVIWKFLVAPTDDYANYISDDKGDERSVWAFTDVDIILGSIAHEFVEKMTGKAFGQDADPPSEDDLLGKRVVGYIRHVIPTTGKSAGKKREEIVAGSIKPFKGPAKKVAPNVTRPEPTEDAAERAELVSRLEKFIGRAVKMETPNHASYVALDLSEGDNDQLRQLIATVQAEVQDALDA
jgi:hypothetical protein